MAKNIIPNSPMKPLEEWKQELHAVDSIKDVWEKIKDAGLTDKGQVGFIVDYDDVISDDNKRQEVQVESVINALKKRGWIN